jgi:hypothetical protein
VNPHFIPHLSKEGIIIIVPTLVTETQRVKSEEF